MIQTYVARDFCRSFYGEIDSRWWKSDEDKTSVRTRPAEQLALDRVIVLASRACKTLRFAASN
jgi:hypothetical protein